MLLHRNEELVHAHLADVRGGEHLRLGLDPLARERGRFVPASGGAILPLIEAMTWDRLGAEVVEVVSGCRRARSLLLFFGFVSFPCSPGGFRRGGKIQLGDLWMLPRQLRLVFLLDRVEQCRLL